MMEYDLTCDLESILAKALAGRELSERDLVYLLTIEEKEQQERVFHVARELRSRTFSDRVFLYGFLYISTYCRNDCNFCFYRKSNSECLRYRKKSADIAEAAGRLCESGVHLLDLTMGEDPFFYQDAGFEKFTYLVAMVKKATGLPIMISPGVIPGRFLKECKKAGATWYACYQETHNGSLYRQLRPGQSFDKRLESKRSAKAQGLLIEEGVLCGIGESAVDLAQSFEIMKALDADQVRAMTFVPQKSIPLSKTYSSDSPRELMTIAVLRLAFPERLIPATLDVEGLAGLKKRLHAGANVITSLVPPGKGLAGVAQRTLDIEEGKRTVAGLEEVLYDCGLRAAAVSEYQCWIYKRQENV
ncbi:[FeFe] hydrogenase maturase subunit HydE [subsurface metagenome]